MKALITLTFDNRFTRLPGELFSRVIVNAD